VKRQINLISSIDWLSVGLYLVLVFFGWLNIFAVNYTMEGDGGFFSLNHRYTMQMIWIFISWFIIVLIFVIDSRFFSFIAYPGFGLGIFLLLSVLVLGTTVNNSKSWIMLGPVGIQPSEFAKIFTILALAKYVSDFNFKITRFKSVFISLCIIGLPPVLIMLQPDFGSTIVYGALLLVLYREGLPGSILLAILVMVIIFLITLMFSQFVVLIILLTSAALIYSFIKRKMKSLIIILLIAIFVGGLFLVLYNLNFFSGNKYLTLLAISIFAGAIIFIFAFRARQKDLYMMLLMLVAAIAFTYSVDYVFHNVMQEHQRNRINVMLGLESDPYGYEYNLRQSKIAIGSGGFAGKGFMNGTQTKFRFVPEQSTDFIFCTVGEEWGFLGSAGLIIVYIGLFIRLLILAERQRAKFSRIYGYGVISVLFFHFAVNLGMTIGLFPVIGIPLPFLSYGGSSLLAFSIMLFIFIRLDASRKTYLL